MTKEELIAKMDIECPDSEISYEHPLPLLYRLYRMYKELQEYNRAVIYVYDYEDESPNIAVKFALVSDDSIRNEWADITVYKDGTWDTYGHIVDLPLAMGAGIDEKAEDEAMQIFVRDLPPI